MELCKLVQRNSKRVWYTLGKAEWVGMQFGEESITDLWVFNMMLDIKKSKTSELAIHTFTKPKESINGADWELWLTGSSGLWLGIRVQAKIINYKSEKFEQLHYIPKSKSKTSPKGESQTEQLIKAARKDGRFPLYCMYSNWNGYMRKAPRVCRAYKPTVYHYGTSILNPFDVIKMKKIKNGSHISEIIKYLKPMHCIFCCTKFDGSDLPTRASDYLQQKIFMINHDDVEKNSEQNFFADTYFLKERPPEYVKLLASDNLDSLLENKEFMEDTTKKSVTIIKECENKNQDSHVKCF